MTFLRFTQKYERKRQVGKQHPHFDSIEQADSVAKGTYVLRPKSTIVSMDGEPFAVWLLTNKVFWGRDELEAAVQPGGQTVAEYMLATGLDGAIFADFLRDVLLYQPGQPIARLLADHWGCFGQESAREGALQLACCEHNWDRGRLIQHLLKSGVPSSELVPHDLDGVVLEKTEAELVEEERQRWLQNAERMRAEYNTRLQKMGDFPTQKAAFEQIVNGIVGTWFLINAVGGSGKGFLIETLLLHFRLQGLIAIAMASSGNAASLLPGGLSIHGAIAMALSGKLLEDAPKEFALLRAAKFVVCDEAFMASVSWLEAAKERIQELCPNAIVLWAGDSCQLPPVFAKTVDIGVDDQRHPVFFFDEEGVTPIGMDCGDRNPRFETKEYSDFCARVRIGAISELSMVDRPAGFGVVRTDTFDCAEVLGELVEGRAEMLCGTHWEKDSVSRLALARFKETYPAKQVHTYRAKSHCLRNPTMDAFGVGDILKRINSLEVAVGMRVALTRNMDFGGRRVPKESRGVVQYCGKTFVAVKFHCLSKTVCVPVMELLENSPMDGHWSVRCIPLRLSWRVFPLMRSHAPYASHASHALCIF